MRASDTPNQSLRVAGSGERGPASDCGIFRGRSIDHHLQPCRLAVACVSADAYGLAHDHQRSADPRSERRRGRRDPRGQQRVYVYKLVAQGVIPKARKHARSGLDRDDVEQLAVARYRPGHPCWVNTVEAAEILDLSRQRVSQLASEIRLPFVEHDGRRLYRRCQVEVVANAREARKLAGRI